MRRGLRNMGMYPLKTYAAAVLCFALGACGKGIDLGLFSSEPEPSAQSLPTSAFTRFPDLPMPPDGTINLDKTLIFGANEEWFGRLVVESSLNANQLFDFFKQKTPKFGWREITSIRAAVSILTYTRAGRVATIQISSLTLSGASAMVTISPRKTNPGPEQPFAGPGMAVQDQGMAPRGLPRADFPPAIPAPVLRR